MTKLPRRLFLPILLLCSLVFVLWLGMYPAISQNKTEILWDTWGVPHIFGKDAEGMFKAFGYAQMESHGDLILRLYGQARGRAAEYWGEQYLKSDRYVHQMGIYRRAQIWNQQQSPTMTRYLEAFAAGINLYAVQHPERLNPTFKAVLPVTSTDILAHIQRTIHYHFVVNPQQVNRGSNGWVIAPSHSTTGKPLLLANPHLPWGDLYLLYETQLVAPQVNIYGVAFVGMPILAIAFNDYLGWTATVNTHNGTTFAQLTLKDGGYVVDGKTFPFETTTEVIKIKQADGTLTTETLTITNSQLGVIIDRQENQATALKIVGLDRPHLPEQLWQMEQARNLKEFETALARLQLPMFNLLYGDRSGNIFYIFNGQIPVHSGGNWQQWQQIQPGNTSNTIWSKYHPYQDLPRLLNPPTGWLQNTNDPPWTSTFPPILKPEDYPPYFAPPNLAGASNLFRTQRSIKMLLEKQKWSLEDVKKAAFSSKLELGDRVVEDLITAARQRANPTAKAAAQVLANWDRQTNANSRGAVLFGLWRLAMGNERFFADSWSENNPLNTPKGLENSDTAVNTLEQVATQMQLMYGTLDIPWGEVVRLRFGNQDLPASGASGILGSFRVIDVTPTENGRFKSVAGDTYIAVIEFGETPRAQVLNTYGNATQPHSHHVGDQLTLYTQEELRPVWRDRAEIETHLESRQEF